MSNIPSNCQPSSSSASSYSNTHLGAGVQQYLSNFIHNVPEAIQNVVNNIYCSYKPWINDASNPPSIRCTNDLSCSPGGLPESCYEELDIMADRVSKLYAEILKSSRTLHDLEGKLTQKKNSDQDLNPLLHSLPEMLAPENFISKLPAISRLVHGSYISLVRDGTLNAFERSKDVLQALTSFFSAYLEKEEKDEFNANAGRYPMLEVTERMAERICSKIGIRANDDTKSYISFLLLLQSRLKKALLFYTSDTSLRREAFRVMRNDERFHNVDPYKMLPLLKLSWMHGSKLSVLEDSMKYSEGYLKPLGELQKDNRLILTGRQNSGSDDDLGLNKKAISGVSLGDARTAIEFAKMEDRSALPELLSSSNRSLKELDKLLCTSRWFEAAAAETNIYQTVRELKKLQTIYPEKFSELKDEIGQGASNIDRCVEHTLRDRFSHGFDELSSIHDQALFFKWINGSERLKGLLSDESVKMSILGDHEDPENARKVPLIFASNSVLGKPLFVPRLQEVTIEEEMYQGALKIGEDLTYLFTTDEHLDRVREKVKELHLDHVRVESIKMLELAQELEEMLRPQLYGLFK